LPENKQTESGIVCMTYFTGIGCPHCAKADPVVLGEALQKNENLIVIEFEVYQNKENAPLMNAYNSGYGSGYYIPLIIVSKERHVFGDKQVISEINQLASSLERNACPLPNARIDFEGLDLASLPGKPKVWGNSRILIKEGSQTPNPAMLKKLLFKDFNTQLLLEKLNAQEVKPVPVALSGKEIEFKHAVRIGGWIFQWNDANTGSTGFNESHVAESQVSSNLSTTMTIAKIVPLAVVDAINPCALAVLTLMLIAIITYNPANKKNVLFAGLAFSLAVFVMYLFYGLVIINFFKFVQVLTNARLLLYKAVGLAAIVLGLLNLKDFVHYKPGGFATEMPLSLRPIVKKITSGITSPKGALVVGMLVTLFLLPCTIGPYVIAGGILSGFGWLEMLPLLLVYNAIFIMPMIAITFIVYNGITRIENVSEWKDKNIRYLHLVAGAIILLLGIAMFFGLV